MGHSRTLVRSFQCGLDDAVYALSVAAAASARRERWRLGIARPPDRQVTIQFGPQARHDVDDSDAGASLGPTDVDLALREVDVALIELAQLPHADPCEAEGGNDCAAWPHRRSAVLLAAVEIYGGTHRGACAIRDLPPAQPLPVARATYLPRAV